MYCVIFNDNNSNYSMILDDNDVSDNDAISNYSKRHDYYDSNYNDMEY